LSTALPAPCYEVVLLAMRDPAVASRAKRLGMRSVLAVISDGTLNVGTLKLFNGRR
jgi:hypothetical protein